MALIKKLSVKTVCGNIKKMVAAEEIKGATPIMRVFGTASRAVVGESDNGPWVAFVGQFKAVNLLDGTEHQSGKLFLPDVASDLLEGAVSANEAGSVEFGFDILAVPDESSAVGYVYQANSLIKPAEDDTLLRLEQNLNPPTDKPATDKVADKPAPTAKKPAKTATA